ncbi:hypothetical protein [Streptomyces sp. NPDC093225]|uniref:hypothetical protein n=1 Tax=Streptomyces sp. NPDC093225 TaxID=3366034 RepID=UPI00380F19CD
MEDLQARLRDAARAHHPDRARMRARVERGVRDAVPRGAAGRRHHPVSWPRIGLAALATATALVIGGVAAHTLVHENGTAHGVAARKVATGPAVPRPGRPTPATPRAGIPGPTPSSGPLRSRGAVDPHSNAYWAQSDITLTTGAPLTALTLEVRIDQTGGVASTGAWRTLPEADFTLVTQRRPDAVVYRWTLKPGRTVPAGEHVFAVQYDHARGTRRTAADGYTATARTTDGTGHTVSGAF